MTMPAEKLKVALIQQKCSEDRTETVEKTKKLIREAAEKGAQLITLQELHTGVYFCQAEDDARFDQAESIPGPSTEEFGALAAELGVVIIVSLFEKRAPGLYHNTAVVLEKDGTIAGIYRKGHIPDDPQFYEKFYFTPGDTGFEPVTTSVGRIGVLICWDQWYPEAARLMSLAGADLLVYPTAIGWKEIDMGDKEDNDRQRDAWITIQRSHAVANGIPVLSINRTGFEPDPMKDGNGINFWGSSFVAGCQGEFLAQASLDQEEVLIAELDKGRSDLVRRAWPFFRDRRIDEYSELLKRYRDV